jgi:HlyD family secretion protein
MDRPIDIEVQKRRTVKRVITALIGLAAVGFVFAAAIEWLRPSLKRNDVVIARVERGRVEATLDANGTIVPLFEQIVSSPVEARVLRVERRAGDRVKTGDELLTLDTAATQLEAARLGERVTQRENDRAKLRLALEESIESLRAQIEQKKLDAEIVRYTAEQKTKLRSEGLISETDALAAQAQAKKAAIELRNLTQALARTIRSRDVQLAASSSEVTMAQREREESRRQVELAMLRADRDGILTSIVNEAGATVRRGDVIARIADLSSYRVDASISDVHAARLAAGMRVRVLLDGVAIGGTIESVDPRIVSGIAKFRVTLDEPAHTQLRNNQRVDVEVITGARNGALVVRRGALGRTNADRAFVVRGDEAVRVPVKFGLAGRETIEILEGLSEGEAVVISDLTEFEDVSEIKLK